MLSIFSGIGRKVRSSCEYFFCFRKHKAFRSNPILVIFRGFLLTLLLVFRKSTIISIRFGSKKFRFNFVPLGRNRGGRGIYLYREKIEPLMEFGHCLLKEGDVVIDGGANQGIFTSAFSSAVGASGQVIAVEPFEYCHELIRRNIALNKNDNVVILKNVLADACKGYLVDFSQGVGKSSILRDFGGVETLSVEGITLNELVEKLDLKRLDLLKLDLEGAELVVLAAGAQIIEWFKPAVVIECERQSFQDINAILEKFSYKPYLIDENGRFENIDYLRSNEDNVFFLRKNHLEKFGV
jgi:FkbM family methyltransferase